MKMAIANEAKPCNKILFSSIKRVTFIRLRGPMVSHSLGTLTNKNKRIKVDGCFQSSSLQKIICNTTERRIKNESHESQFSSEAKFEILIKLFYAFVIQSRWKMEKEKLPGFFPRLKALKSSLTVDFERFCGVQNIVWRNLDKSSPSLQDFTIFRFMNPYSPFSQLFKSRFSHRLSINIFRLPRTNSHTRMPRSKKCN